MQAAFKTATYAEGDNPYLDNVGAADVVGHRRRESSIDELAATGDLHFVKTHRLPRAEARAVYIVRDGRDALVSYARYLCDLGKPPSRHKHHAAERLLNWFDPHRAYRRVLLKLCRGEGSEFGLGPSTFRHGWNAWRRGVSLSSGTRTWFAIP